MNAVGEATVVAVAGVSCRQQIEHFTDRSTTHIAEVLAGRIQPGHVWAPADGAGETAAATDETGVDGRLP